METRRELTAIESTLAADVARLKQENERLRQWLAVVLDQVDYTTGACRVNEMIGACLSDDVIAQARAALGGKP